MYYGKVACIYRRTATRNTRRSRGWPVSWSEGTAARKGDGRLQPSGGDSLVSREPLHHPSDQLSTRASIVSEVLPHAALRAGAAPRAPEFPPGDSGTRDDASSMPPLTTLRASRRQWIGAIGLGATLTILAALVIPYSQQPLTPAPGAVPIFSTLALVADFAIAGLLFSQYRLRPAVALAVLATTYLVGGAITLPYLISFPGVILTHGALGAGSQTPSWLWVYSKGSVAIGLLLYQVVELLGLPPPRGRTIVYALPLALMLAGIALVVVLTMLALRPPLMFPLLIHAGDYTLLVRSGVGPAVWGLCLTASLVLIARAALRQGGPTVLDLGLCVGAQVALLDVTLSLSAGVRYTTGWYASRLDSVVAAAIVLVALFYEVQRLSALLTASEYHVRALNDDLERRVAERTEALLVATRARDQFFDNAAHELKTPLTTLQGSVGLAARRVTALRSRAVPSATDASSFDVQITELDGLLARAQRQFVRLNRLIDDLLDASRIETGRFQLQIAPCQLDDIIRDTMALLEPLAAPSGLRYIDHLEGPLTVVADADRLSQVISNFIVNAIKYAPTAHPIEVGISADDMMVRVWVRDYGRGIPVEERGRIWERSYQITERPTYLASHVGLGLGLYICQSIIDAHGGGIGVEDAPGGGAIFWFTIPRAITLEQ